METEQAHEDGLWRRVLLSSPWFDCPIFEDLLSEPQKTKDGEIMRRKNGEVRMKRRDPHFAGLEAEFFRRWWFEASQLPLRRFENGDAVLPMTAPYYRTLYGDEAMKWKIGEVDEVESDGTGATGVSPGYEADDEVEGESEQGLGEEMSSEDGWSRMNIG
ncbi:hypothetical protein NW762_013591 [Fusarium torreyae]|uniref:Uncharacterized protein n=1 Tax=Fusarium torreyae TaxID=1237075 RepID=A0A9W8RK56_9HYPO|nr:hypothetical protein NW762_013591 [Fusarium torreyae]